MTGNSSIDKLRALKPRFSEMNIRRMRVFGSRVRGDARPDSDIDLLVDFIKTPDLWTFMDTKADLERALGCRVDLVTPKGLHPALRDNVLAEARDV